MKYSELVNFDPIESIIVLKDADQKERAERLIKSYVMSDNMAQDLIDIVLPELQYDRTIDNKGIFIVGNYGTGKSHLMSVLSTVAQDETMLQYVKNDKFISAFKTISGKFEVIRMITGSSKMSLRDIVLTEIEKDLNKRGIIYHFPPMDKVPNNIGIMMEMMDKFNEKYPDKGYLIVLDELLDYLQSRTAYELMSDLTFLREIGEMCKNSRLRFITGVQESLFDNPKFHNVASTILKVKDRFTQLLIKRDDISYVVSERLLKKNKEQKAWIREHLQIFCVLYKNMSDRLEDYVNLYPIHPAYIETFEKVYIAEKREVLKTISMNIKSIINNEIPENETGLISYDAYWDFIKNNRSLWTELSIKEVAEKSEKLEGIIEHSYTRELYKPMALRIIKALSVYRLTTGDISLPVGLTIENLKDDLCLYTDMPDMEEDFLYTTVQSVVKEIMKTVSGQFITHNEANDQYYIDIHKDVDYDQKIIDRISSLNDDELNGSYYKIILNALEWTSGEYIQGRNIWQYSIRWVEKNVERFGYLFLGGPNDRPTAQPPRDFYVYFMMPYGKTFDNYEGAPDEVFVEFINKDEKIDTLIKKIAAAEYERLLASNEGKKVFLDKINDYKRQATNWMRDNFSSCFKIRYMGIDNSIMGWLKGHMPQDRSFKSLISYVSSICLSGHFDELYPEYPKFLTYVTRFNLREVFISTLNFLEGKKDDVGSKIFDSLNLLEDGVISPYKSKYAKYIMSLLDKLPEGHVINRQDLIKEISEGEYIDKKFNLEIEWFIVILLSLVYSGDIVISIPGGIIDATKLENIHTVNIPNLVEFMHIEKPKDIPIKSLTKLMEKLNLPVGLIKNPNNRKDAIISISKKIDEILNKLTSSGQILISDITLWDYKFINQDVKTDYKNKINSFRDFLDDIRKYNTPAKLKNFKYSESDIEKQFEALNIIEYLDKIKYVKDLLDKNISYLKSAELIFKDNDWIKEINSAKQKANDIVLNIMNVDEDAIRQYDLYLDNLKNKYISLYIDYHKKYRLDSHGDEEKKKFMKSKVKRNLNMLTKIKSIIPAYKLTQIEEKVSALQTCYNLTNNDLNDNVLCPYCKFNPQEYNAFVFGVIDDALNELDALYESWTEIIKNNLDDEMVKSNIIYLKENQQKAINTFLSEGRLPEDIDMEFISAVNDLLSGLEKVEINIEDLKKNAIGDSPATPDEIKIKFNKYIDNLTRGKDLNKVRIIIK